MTQRSTAAEMGRTFKVDGPLPNSQARYNGAPRQKLLILRYNTDAGRRSLDPAEWGLLPTWERDPKTARRPINAKAETIDTLPTFRAAFTDRRCILPIDSFFEWKAIRGAQQPYAIGMADGAPFGIAGLWENWQDKGSGEWLRTFCVATVPANPLMEKIHDRMPAILHEEDYGAWLGEVDAGPVELKALLVPYEPYRAMTMWPVNPRMNSWRVDDPAILDICDIIEEDE